MFCEYLPIREVAFSLAGACNLKEPLFKRQKNERFEGVFIQSFYSSGWKAMFFNVQFKTFYIKLSLMQIHFIKPGRLSFLPH